MSGSILTRLNNALVRKGLWKSMVRLLTFQRLRGSRRARQGLTILINVLIIGAFSYYVYTDIGLAPIQGLIARIHPFVIALCFLAYFSSFFLGAARISLILRPLVRLPYRKVLLADLLATSLGIFTPGSLGMPVAYTLLLRKNGVSLKKAIFALTVDRGISLGVTLVLGTVGILLLYRGLLAPLEALLTPEVVAGALILTLLVMAALAWVLRRYLAAYLKRLVSNLWALYRDHLNLFLYNTLLAFVVLCISAAILTLLLDAFDAPLPFWVLVLTSSLMSLMVYIPVSYLGIGIQDVGSIVLLGQLGVPAEVVIAMLLVVRCVYILSSLLIILFRNRLNQMLD